MSRTTLVKNQKKVIISSKMTKRLTTEFFFESLIPADNFDTQHYAFKEDLVDQALKAPLEGIEDLALFGVLVNLAHDELREFGTSKANRLNDEEIELVLRACKRVAIRVGIDFPTLPFRDFAGFLKYWMKNEMSGSWAARRDYLSDQFDPVEQEIFLVEEREWDQTLVEPVSPKGATGWNVVDREIAQLRKRFAAATTDQDYASVGTACVRVLEKLSELVFDPVRHSDPTFPNPPTTDQTKIRLELFFKTELGGKSNEDTRKLAFGIVGLAHKVKHDPTPTRRDAGVAADSVIMLANLCKRIASS